VRDVVYPISIATDNETTTIRADLILLGFVVSGSMTPFDVGFDDIYFSPPFILMSRFEVVDSASLGNKHTCREIFLISYTIIS